MASFQPEKLQRHIELGVSLVALNIQGTRQQAREIIASDMSEIRSEAALRTWIGQPRATPVPAEILSLLALSCLKRGAPLVSPEWIVQLCATNGMERVDMAPALRQELDQREAGRWPATDMTTYDLAAMTTAYTAQVTTWASSMRLIGGTPGDLVHGYIPARLEPFQAVGIGRFTGADLALGEEALDAQGLLGCGHLRLAIVGPAGRGKSALWQHLARLVAQGAAGATLPVPIDWRDVGEKDVDDAPALLRVTIQHLWPQCSPTERGVWAHHLMDRLRAGTAVALIDNWQGLRPLPRRRADRLRTALATWPRLIILGRYAPQPGDVAVQSFVLARLDDQEIAHFVRAWPAVTGRPLDCKAIMNRVARSETWRDLTHEPWFLDLVCAAVSEHPGQLPGLWVLLDAALTAFVAQETQGRVPGVDVELRAALADLAGSGYWGARPDQPVQRTFAPAQVSERWHARWDTRGQQLFGLVYESGLLRPA
ncbi:MAG: hypothetical protein KKA73_21505, partial [Chloroflexi bacterium]|nr:hypothetical protein [Chloroflexota bacterium]